MVIIKNWIVGQCNRRVFIGLAIMVYINNSRHLARKYALIFVRGHYLFREANSFPRAKLEESCELRGTDNVQGQISEHIFAPNGDYCLFILQIFFATRAVLKIRGIFSDIPHLLGNIRSRDAFRPIARKQKDLMDCKSHYTMLYKYGKQTRDFSGFFVLS